MSCIIYYILISLIIHSISLTITPIFYHMLVTCHNLPYDGVQKDIYNEETPRIATGDRPNADGVKILPRISRNKRKF